MLVDVLMIETVILLANALRGRGITINAGAPGPVAVELFLSDKSTGQSATLAKVAPLERLGQPDDIRVPFRVGEA
jgi:3-oxoacyl-[acyl-carrier protein] reductase